MGFEGGFYPPKFYKICMRSREVDSLIDVSLKINHHDKDSVDVDIIQYTTFPKTYRQVSFFIVNTGFTWKFETPISKCFCAIAANEQVKVKE